MDNIENNISKVIDSKSAKINFYIKLALLPLAIIICLIGQYIDYLHVSLPIDLSFFNVRDFTFSLTHITHRESQEKTYIGSILGGTVGLYIMFLALYLLFRWKLRESFIQNKTKFIRGSFAVLLIFAWGIVSRLMIIGQYVEATKICSSAPNKNKHKFCKETPNCLYTANLNPKTDLEKEILDRCVLEVMKQNGYQTCTDKHLDSLKDSKEIMESVINEGLMMRKFLLKESFRRKILGCPEEQLFHPN